jgi:hypothetical protein
MLEVASFSSAEDTIGGSVGDPEGCSGRIAKLKKLGITFPNQQNFWISHGMGHFPLPANRPGARAV